LNPLRPLGLGELLDRSVNFWRAHWKPLFWLILGFQLVEGTIVATSQGLGRFLFPLAGDPTALKNPNPAVLAQMGGKTALLIFAVLVALFISQVAGVAVSHYSYSRLIKKGQPDASDSFRVAAARLGTTTGAFVLSMGWSLIVMVLFMLPAGLLFGGAIALGLNGQQGLATVVGILAVIALILGSIVLVLWFAIRFILVSQIVAVEPLGAFATFRRADALSSGRVFAGAAGIVKLRLTVLVTIVGTVLLIIGIVASIPTLVAGAIYGATLQPGNTVEDVVPLYVLAPLQLVQSVLGALLAPLYTVFQTFFYTDMRVRREGLDLDLALTPPHPDPLPKAEGVSVLA
jgi:hypothetical protein